MTRPWSTTSLFYFSLLLCIARCFGQSETEAYSTSYLSRMIGARTIGMGGAYTSVVNEPNAIFCNPGALASQSENVSLSAMTSVLSFGRYHSTLAVTKNLSKDFGIGLGINNFTNASFTHRDAVGADLGSASYQQFCATVGAGYMIGNAGFGACAKYLQNSLSAIGLRSSGFAFDVGAKLPFYKYFNFGLALQNIGSVQWNNSSSSSEPLAWVIRSGLSTEIPLASEEYVVRSTTLGEADTVITPSSRYILLALEADFIRGSAAPQIILGAEYSLAELFALRGGVCLVGDQFGQTMLFPGTVTSGGLSYRIHAPELPFQFQVDYAASRDFTSQSGITHHFSVSAVF